MIFLGIDVGLTGAVAAVAPSGALQWVNDLPVRDAGKAQRKAGEIDGAELARMLRVHVADIGEAWIEEVQAMPPYRFNKRTGERALAGTASSFSLGDSRGCIRGVCEALGLPVQRVSPRTWKKHYGLVGAESKEASRAMAIRLYPGCDLLQRKKDHGRAEAILLARYGAQMARMGESFLQQRPPLALEG